MSDPVAPLSPRAKYVTDKVTRRYLEALNVQSNDSILYANITGGQGYLVANPSSQSSLTRSFVEVADRTTITNPAGIAGNTIIDISATYAGQATITTLGTVTVGTWHGSTIDSIYLTNTAVASLSGVNTGDQTITLSGDISGSGTAGITATLATVNSNVGSFGDGTHVAAFTVNAKGLITAVSDVLITGAAPTGSAGGELAGTYPNPTLVNSAVIGKVLTGYTSGAGTVAATDTILQAIQKLNGNDATNANLTGPITSVGNATAIASQTGNGTKFVMDDSPTLITPVLGTPNSGTLTNCTGYTDANLSTSDVTTNNASTSKHGFLKKLSNTATEYMDGSGNWSTPAGTGKLINRVSSSTTAVTTGTTTIPIDDTIPQNTEGDQYLSVSITPSNSSNILTIHCVIVLESSAINQHMGVALFQDSTASALAATNFFHGQNGVMYTHTLTHTMTAGTTSATTFKIRAGGNSASTTTINGIAGARYYGGVMESIITVTETSL